MRKKWRAASGERRVKECISPRRTQRERREEKPRRRAHLPPTKVGHPRRGKTKKRRQECLCCLGRKKRRRCCGRRIRLCEELGRILKPGGTLIRRLRRLWN